MNDQPIYAGQLPEVVVSGDPYRYRRMPFLLNKPYDENLIARRDNIPGPVSEKSERASKGTRAYSNWTKEHPILEKWGNVLGAVPLAIASYPLISTAGAGLNALGDAAASTTAGWAIASA